SARIPGARWRLRSRLAGRTSRMFSYSYYTHIVPTKSRGLEELVLHKTKRAAPRGGPGSGRLLPHPRSAAARKSMIASGSGGVKLGRVAYHALRLAMRRVLALPTGAAEEATVTLCHGAYGALW